MTAVISTTYDDRYLWFLPLTTWAWNKLGVDVVCFMPYRNTSGDRFMLVSDTLVKINAKGVIYNFDCPEHKEATYAQCSRLYGACLDLPEDEILVTGDIDMLLLANPAINLNRDCFYVLGADLVPEKQYPICYLMSSVKKWKEVFGISNQTHQQKLDELLGDIDCENMRGNYWGKDQEEAFNKISQCQHKVLINRAILGTQFAGNRYDRDDAFLLDRLSLNTVDYHMNRPGYEESNFNKILTVLQYHYPNDNFSWLVEYNEKYKQLL